MLLHQCETIYPCVFSNIVRMKDIRLYKTDEIQRDLWETIVDGFNTCFPDHKKSVDEYIERYRANPFGYCYHALYYEDGELAGFNSITPQKYLIDGKTVDLGLSGDTYVLPQFRKNIFIFMYLYNALKEYCAKDGIVAFLGVPNQNSYVYSIKLLQCKEVFTLDYWILPVTVGDLLKKQRWLNFFSTIYARLSACVNLFVSTLFNSIEEKPRIRLIDNDEFLDKRLAGNKYTRIKSGKYSFSYTVTEDEGIRCAYIMHIVEKANRSYRALAKCVNYILAHEKVSVIMYNGTLHLKQGVLVKTPTSYIPRKLPFTVNFLSKEYEAQYAFMLDAPSWDFTLLNLDVR